MKKGQGMQNFVNKIILFLLVAVILLAFYAKFQAKVSEGTEKQLCRQSIIAQTSLGSEQMPQVGDFECPTQFHKIKKSQDTKKVLAEGMASCWGQFFRGTKQLYRLKEFEKKAFCLPCSHFQFAKKEKVPADEFTEYLKENKFNPEDESGKVTYYDYLTNNAQRGTSNFEKATGIDIDTNKDQMIVFVYKTKKEKTGLYELFKAGTNEVLATGVGILVGGNFATLTFISVGVHLWGPDFGGSLSNYFGKGVNYQWEAATVLVPFDENDNSALGSLGCNELPIAIKKEE